MFPSPNTSSASPAAKSTKSIVNACTQSGWAANSINITSSVSSGAISATSGAMTAATLKTLLSLSSASGQMTFLTIRTVDATARTIQIKITVDGIVACNATSASITTAARGGVWAGAPTAGSATVFPPIFWKSTLLIEYASSLTETDKLTVEYAYNTES